MKTIGEIKATQAQLREKLRTEGKDLLKPEFAAFFEANPRVEAVRWTQYTPYFNDGEACVFSVNDFEVRLGEPAGSVSDDAEEDDEDGEWLDHWALTRESVCVQRGTKEQPGWNGKMQTVPNYVDVPKKPIGRDIAEALGKLEDAVNDEDVMQAVFGDHVQVTATRDGFTTEEYSHE